MTLPDRAPTLGYLVNRHPELSQTFIRLEVDAVRRLGARVLIASARRGRSGGVDEQDPEHVVISELAEDHRANQRTAALFGARHPIRSARAALVRRHLDSEIGREHQIMRPSGLVALAARWERAGVQHVHAHFAWEGAAAAMVVSRLLGCTWSVTVHANDMYGRRWNLPTKLRDADLVVTVCEYNRQRLHELEGVTGRIPIVVCGVEEAPLATGPKRYDVMAVGRLMEKKGFDLLITAAAILRPDHPDLRVGIVGEGPRREALERLAAGLGVADAVHFLGPRPHEEVLEHVGAARVVVLPCRIAANDDRDSMPVVVKEAMVRGIPVIGADLAGMDEMIDATTGRLVPANDAGVIADALGELLGDDDLRARLGLAARERALRSFLIDDGARALLDELGALRPRRASPRTAWTRARARARRSS